MSEKRKRDAILKYLGEEKVIEIDEFVRDVSERNFREFSSAEETENFFRNYLTEFYNNISATDIDTIISYTGIAFRRFNSLLRGFWSYEENGALTEEKKKLYLESIDKLSKFIAKANNLPDDIKTFRGTSLESFRDYGVRSLDDLKSLENSYYFESGFTSTSLIREKSFFNRELEYHNFCNIEIEYLIPEEANDGIPLITDDLSFSKSQSEFLLNRDSLTKIIEVDINSDKNCAYMKAILVPQKMWNITLKKENGLNSSKTR